jgi:sensor histidine kinase YesM
MSLRGCSREQCDSDRVAVEVSMQHSAAVSPAAEPNEGASRRTKRAEPDTQLRELAPDALVALPSLLKYSTTWRLLGWWTVAYGLSSWIIEYLVSKLDRSANIGFLFASNRVVYAIVWSGAIVVAIVATELLPVTSPRQVGRVAFHAAVCVAVTLLWGVIAYYLCLLIVPGWQPLGVPKMLTATAKNVLFGYGLVVVVVHITLRVRAHRAHEVALLRQAHLAAQAQLQVLKLEMQPHFLFNALHSVSALIDSDPAAANDTLVMVSDMLRHAVETARVQEVSLREEIRSVRLYTQIQQVRFGERLKLSWQVDDDALDAAVPHMLLQPLVENAIKHGIEAHSTAGRIEIGAVRDRDGILITIRDDGPGCSLPSPRRGPGKGVANVRSRVAQLYPERHVFELADANGGGAQVTIRIPFIAMPVSPGVQEPSEQTESNREQLGAKAKRELMSA